MNRFRSVVAIGPILLLALLILVFWRLWKWINAGGSGSDAERKRILGMVESGKMSSEEGAELLDAMGKSSALRGEEKFSRPDMVVLLGSSLVVLGFFLPWGYVSMAGIRGYQAGYDCGALGWAVLIISIVSTLPLFITPKNFLYKISMLQIFLSLIGTAIVMSALVRAGNRFGAGIAVCLVGFVLELLACLVKFKKLAA